MKRDLKRLRASRRSILDLDCAQGEIFIKLSIFVVDKIQKPKKAERDLNKWDILGTDYLAIFQRYSK